MFDGFIVLDSASATTRFLKALSAPFPRLPPTGEGADTVTDDFRSEKQGPKISLFQNVQILLP